MLHSNDPIGRVFQSLQLHLRGLAASEGIVVLALVLWLSLLHGPYATASDAGPLAANMVRSATDLNRRQSPSSSLNSPEKNSLTLNSCPPGVLANESWYHNYISGAGTPEAVQVTGGTCKGDGRLGTLEFTTTSSHSSGYAISSASGGVQEASIAARFTPTNQIGIVGDRPSSNAYQDITQARAMTAGYKFSGERIVDTSWNWHQLPKDDLGTAGENTIHLAPCPLGIDTSDNPYALYYVYISGIGTPEAVVVTGGNCTAGAASGTIIVTTAYSHSAGYTVGSASTGIQEAINDAEHNGGTSLADNWRIKLQPTNPPSSAYYAIYAPVTIVQGIGDIDGSGASLDIETPSFAFYFPLSNRSGEAVIHGFRLGTKTTMSGAPVTNVACSSNVSTITSTLNPVVGSYVDFQWTDNTHYWGVHGPVVTSSSSSFTLPDNNCAWALGTGRGTIASAASLGNVAPVHAFILDNGQNLTVRDIYFHPPGWSGGGKLNNGIVLWNDQAFNADNILAGSAINCSAKYCGQVIYAPGGTISGGSMAAIGHLSNLNLSMQCNGNGINWLSGNSLDVTDSIIQGQSQFQAQIGTMRGNYAASSFTNVYGESSGACLNPFYTAVGLAGAASVSQSGVNVLGNDVHFGPDPVGPTGVLPNFATGGATTYTYYSVIHDGSNIAVPLPFGIATPSAYPITVGYPRYASQTGSTVTYDILKVPNTARRWRGAPLLNGVIQAIAVATGVSQCSSLVCTLIDTGTVSNYAPSNSIPSLDPYLWNWPGNLILSKGGRQYGLSILGGFGGTVTTRPDYQTVFVSMCNQDSPNVYVSCLATDIGSSGHPNGATLLPNTSNFGGGSTDLKGRLNFSGSYASTPVVGEVITIHDSNPASTLADSLHRPTADANDSWIGLDYAASLSAVGMAFSAPVSIDECIAKTPSSCYTTPGERLSAAAKIFNVPVTINGDLTVTGKCAGCVLPVSVAAPPGAASWRKAVSLTGQAADIAVKELCPATTCGAGQYRITYYLDSIGVCASPGSAAVILSITWRDETATRTLKVPLAGSGISGGDSLNLGVASNFGSGEISLWSGGDATINYSTSYSPCSSGFGKYDLRLVAEKIQ